MKRYLLGIIALFACQLFLTQVCQIDGKWLLMGEVKAQESDKGFTDGTILPADGRSGENTPQPSEPTTFKGVTKNTLTRGSKDLYSIKMYYPSFGKKEADAAIRFWAERYCNEFIKDALKDYEEDSEIYRKWEMIGTYSVTQSSPNAISVLFRIYIYSGGAHGSFEYVARTFDTKTWKEIPHDKFFTDQKSALTILSEHCRAELAKSGDIVIDAAQEGTAPTPEKYDVIVPRQKGLLVVFYPGQLTCFAEGTRTVFVPLEKFRKYIEPGKIWR